MHQELVIWCPVVITSLAVPRKLQQRNSYPMAENYRRIEDIKIRIKACQAQVQGKYVEIKVLAAWICLLEDYQGRPCSIKREDVLKDRVDLREFDQLADYQQELRYVPDISNFSWDAELKEKVINISYELSYKLMGAREQLVLIQTSHEQASSTTNASAKAAQSNVMADPLTEENRNLRRQIHFYETNLSSLKRGIKKTEKDNYNLSMELKSYQDKFEELRNTVDKTNRFISNDNNRSSKRDTPKSKSAHEPDKLGQRIKNLFNNNL